MDTSEDKKGEPSKSGITITDATIRNVENIPKAVDVEAIVNESNLSQIRNSVNENSIQLWKEPYFDKDKKVPNENKLLELACNLSTTLELVPVIVEGFGAGYHQTKVTIRFLCF